MKTLLKYYQPSIRLETRTTDYTVHPVQEVVVDGPVERYLTLLRVNGPLVVISTEVLDD